MSVNCDGGTESIIPDAKSPDLQHGETSFEEENFSPEAFRGFETKPVVLLERYNITPYLNKLKSSFISDDIEQYVSANNPVSMKILQQCRVNLVRDDLLNLKRSLANQSPRSDVSESVADEAMGHLKCKICKKIYSSEKKLLNHQENKHMIVYRPESKPQKRVSFSEHVIIHEVKEYHKCRKCPRIFEDYKSLKVHMKHQHKKRKCYICNYCNKNFVDRMFFKVHIKLHCDVCGLLLPNKAKYIEHRRNVCRVLKLHKCKTCDSSFFKFMDLKDHSYEHISTYFICDICKDQLATKCAVSHHIKFLHSKERPKDHSSASLYTMRNLGTERLYLCNFCDETSVDRDILEYHVQALPDLSNRAMTGYKDYYFCDQCLKKFDTEKDMLQHKWTHFLKTSDNSQERNAEIGTSKIKTTYKVGEKLPKSMQPMLILKKVNIDGGVVSNQEDEDEGLVDVLTVDVMTNGEVKKAIVDPKSKKTIISKHQCQVCIDNINRLLVKPSCCFSWR